MFVGYRRNSVEETTEKSQARQKTNIENYAARTNLIRLRDDFVDEGVTGTSTHDRHEFTALMELVARGQVHVIVIEDIDRFSRNFADTLRYYDLLVRHGVELHDIKHGFLNLAHITILGFMAAEGRVRLLDVLSSGKRKAVENGRHVGPPIFGYRKHPTTRGERVIVPERAETVRWIYQQAADGVGTATIARLLTDKGTPSPRQCAREDALKTLPQKPFPWCKTQVRHLLTNPLTMGVLVWGRTATTRDHQTKRITSREKRSLEDLTIGESKALRIVDPKLWAAANAGLKSRSFGSGSEFSRSQVYLMTPVTTCGVCGSRMHVKETNNRATYVCSDSRTYLSDRCPANRTIRTEWLEAHVLEVIRDSVLTPDREAKFREAYVRGWAEADGERIRKLAEVRREAARVDALLDASMNETVTAGLSTARVEKWRHRMEAQLADLREREQVLSERGDPVANLARLDTLTQGLEAMIAAAPNKVQTAEEVKLADAFRKLVTAVVVGPPDEDERRVILIEVNLTGIVEPDREVGAEMPSQSIETTLDVCALMARETAERKVSCNAELEATANDVRDLDDEAWAILEPLVCEVPLIDGREPRRVIDGMLLVIKTGTPRALTQVPSRCGDPGSFRRAAWSVIYHGAWDAVVSALREHRPEYLKGADLRRFETTSWPRKAAKIARRGAERVDDRSLSERRAELETAIAASVDERERSRLRVALAWVNGCAESGIAQSMGLSQGHVYDVTALYRCQGVEGLAAKVRIDGPGPNRKLTPDQEAEMVALAMGGVDPERIRKDGTPAPIRYDDLIRLTKARFGVEYSRMGMLQLLRRSNVRLADTRRSAMPSVTARPGVSPVAEPSP